ncbi:CobW family GTP-binding protein [Natrononativus amylolyticus]|uniref:CobW family GTP-binding protein n=1 Tax=Natrononativus amylolyticus TaxID=2963434 RepID=UPI0020CC9C5A|nr:GTP-binding protein [Natrononativus amylolyticus]
MRSTTIPVTVLSGSLGAGKTTLVNHLLRNAGDRNLAVLVNDMGSVNVDADLVAEGSDLAVDDGIAELSNGCICCELQDDLETAVVRLAREREFDHLLVEASGISEPAPVARLFTTASRVAARYEIDALVTVLDTRLFLDAFDGESVPERRGADEETRPLSDLLVEQLECSNLVLLNKADQCTTAELERAEELVRTLRPGVETVRTEFSAVDPARLFDTGLFDPGQLGELAGWHRALEDGAAAGDAGHDHHADDDHGHRHPDEVYGVDSFVVRERRPLDPRQFAAFLEALPPTVVRSKGTAWVAGNEQRLTVHQAGPSVRVTAAGPWIASLPELDRELYRSNRPDLEWHNEHGDRLTELVFIGTGLDEPALRAALEECLLEEPAAPAGTNDESRFPAEPGAERVLREP